MPNADASPSTELDTLHFDGFSILPSQRRLLVGGEPVKLGARAYDLLLVLASSRDRVVTKEELLDRVWPGLVVEEGNLAVHVSQLRKLCGPGAIATVPGRGYQFTATSVGAVTTNGGRPAGAAPSSDGLEASPVSAGGNLPAVLPPLIGRETEQLELAQMLAEHRWVTVSGGGGMGKTRLAEAVGLARSCEMPVWLIELAMVNAPELVASAVAQALGATVVDIEHVVDALVGALSGAPVLLILDNCEHLAEPVGELCSRLLALLPQLRVLVTSQELLRRTEEMVFKLGPLSLPAPGDTAAANASGALMLLRARVRAQWRQFEITAENLADATAICRELDGLPLAIELAAGRVPLLGLAGVRARLGEMFRLLTGDARVRLRRHQTLRAALDWSYQLLDAGEQRLLRRLGSFNGSFGIPGVRELGSEPGEDDWQVLDMLGSLVDKSLVQVRDHEHPRYLLLPKVGMTTAPLSLALGALPTIRRLMREGFDFDLIDAHYYYPDGVAAALLAQWLRKPLAITARGTDLNLIPQHALPRRMIHWAAGRAQASIGVCSALVDVLRGWQIDPARLHVMRNGVDLQRFSPRPQAEARRELGLDGGPLLISVGHLIERKGNHLTIAAMPQVLQRHPGARLLLVGDGVERARLEAQAASLGLQAQVRFVGPVANDRLAAWYSAADVSVLASSREGWANVLLESMACGTPVVATNIWGTPEVVADAVAGELVECRDAASLAAGVLRLLERMPAPSAVRRYAEGFGWAATSQAQVDVFRHLANHGGVGGA